MAEYSIGGIVFAITVDSVSSIKLIPERRNIVNRFDEHGDTLTLNRLPDEDNVAFRQRMLDIHVHPGGPTYEGLVNNLSRELGFLRMPAMTIDLKRDSSGQPIAPNPRVDILASEIILYSNWQDYDVYTIDKTINIYDSGSAGYYLRDLVAEINTSDYFIAGIDTGVRPNLHSTNLIRGTTYREARENIRADKQFIFRYDLITRGSIWFSDKNIFRTEVLVEPQNPGEYYINYTNGYVVSNDISDGTKICGYIYAKFPFEVDASLIHVYTLQDDNFVKKLFIQEVLESGESVNGLPNTEGAEIYHQVFKDTKMFWGV